ncbi:hypothetical protein [Frankia canadensis]|uniref:hypothetical protein n=1 Tax=Frankia canadensis TaxID=1836972 RepID=UPI000C7A0753|nr:hypothetical protein [Frankia canadensis]
MFGLTMALGACNSGQQQAAVPTSTVVDTARSETPTATASPTLAVTASPTFTSPTSASPTSASQASASQASVATASPSPVAAIADAVKRDPDVAQDAVVEKVTVSSIDPTWAVAAASSPTAGGAQAVLHRTRGTWKVVDLGSSEVGCGVGVPAAVRTELGLECPS